MRSFMISFITLTLGITRCYLIPCNQGYLLVDTSSENQYLHFQKVLKKRDVTIDKIKYVLLTHHHTDHTGFLQQLLDSSGATLIVHPDALPFLEQGINNPDMKATTGFIAILMKMRGFFSESKKSPSCKPDRCIFIPADDDTFLRDIGISGRIVCLPGHTSDGLAIIMDDGNVFAGDVAMNWKLLPVPYHLPLVAEDMALLKASWEKIGKLGGRHLYVSHGKDFSYNELKTN